MEGTGNFRFRSTKRRRMSTSLRKLNIMSIMRRKPDVSEIHSDTSDMEMN